MRSRSFLNAFPGNTVPLVIWTVIEGHPAIICACLPALQPLVSRIFRCMGSSTSKDPGSYSLSGVKTTVTGPATGHKRQQDETWSRAGSTAELNKDMDAIEVT